MARIWHIAFARRADNGFILQILKGWLDYILLNMESFQLYIYNHAVIDIKN